MNILELVKQRHSVRRYLLKPVEEELIKQIQNELDMVNKNDINIQLVTNDAKPFSKFLGVVPFIKNCENYLVLVGKKANDLHEKLGYWGQHMVLFLQGLGLNTCWVAGTYNKKYVKAEIGFEDEFVCLIAFGYGKNAGVPHKGKTFSNVSKSMYNDVPKWYFEGVSCALLAPTARNQQKFKFQFIEPNKVRAYAQAGPWTKLDLGIVKYHFELAAGKENFVWAD